jgi:phosphoserine phosphatase
MLGFDHTFANTLLVENGRLTGRVADPVLDQAAKRDRLLELAAAADLELSQTLAVGDGSNDLAMLEAAGLGVAFRAKPAVRSAMLNSPTGAAIDHADLTALLHLQGLSAPPA